MSDLLLFLFFTVAPGLISAYFTFIFASVKGFPKIPLVVLSLIFGALVPLILFFIQPKENIAHPIHPGSDSELLLKTPSILRRDPDKNVEEPGYLFVTEGKIVWVPRNNSNGYIWDYEFGLPLGKTRIYRSGLLSWMLFPSNADKPVSISLGNKGSFARLHIATGLMALKNGDMHIIEQLREGRSIWRFGQKGENKND